MVGQSTFLPGYVGQNENWWHILLYTSDPGSPTTMNLGRGGGGGQSQEVLTHPPTPSFKRINQGPVEWPGKR